MRTFLQVSLGVCAAGSFHDGPADNSVMRTSCHQINTTLSLSRSQPTRALFADVAQEVSGGPSIATRLDLSSGPYASRQRGGLSGARQRAQLTLARTGFGWGFGCGFGWGFVGVGCGFGVAAEDTGFAVGLAVGFAVGLAAGGGGDGELAGTRKTAGTAP